MQQVDGNGLIMCSGRIMVALPTDHFRSDLLGEDDIGVTVQDVFIEELERIMSYEL